MPREIPFNPDAEFIGLQVELTGVTFGLEFRWNARAEAWFASLFSAEGVGLIAGRRVNVGVPIWLRAPGSAIPAGQLVAVDTSERDEEAGLSDLGRRVKLIYFEPSEFAA